MEKSDLQRIGRKYAEILFEMGEHTKTTEEIHSFVDSFAALLSTEQSLRDFFFDPRYSAEDHKKVLDTLSEQLKVPSTLQKFFALVARYRDSASLPFILEAFKDLYQKHSGTLSVGFETPTVLTDTDKAEVKKRLEEKFKTSLVIDYKVKESLLGGFIIYVNGKVLNASIAGYLNQFKQTMKGLSR